MTEIEETAKATQEVAKTTGQAITAGRELGQFLGRVFGGTITQAVGVVEDQLVMFRQARQLRLAKRYDEIRRELGYNSESSVPYNFGVALIQAASLEQDDVIQDAYARLLARAMSGEVQARRAYVSILEDLGPLEVRLLDLIYRASPDAIRTVKTGNFPDGYLSDNDSPDLQPPQEVAIALGNLVRVGCISAAGTWGGGSTVSVVSLTPFGKSFVEAALSTKA